MSTKWLGIYSSFFVAMLALALFVTGTFQQGILPRMWGPAAREAPGTEGAEAQAKGQPPAQENPGSQVKPGPVAASDQATVGAAASETPAATGSSRPAKETSQEKVTQVQRLARVYEGMRPKEAASVIERLDRPLAVRVLSEMKDRQAAKVLGAMNPSTAAELTRMLGQGSERDSP